MKLTMSTYHDLRGQRATAVTAHPVDATKLQQIIARAEEALTPMEAACDRRRACILVFDPNVRYTREQRDASHRAEEDVATMMSGRWHDGYWHADLREFADGPGIDTLRRLIADCREALETAASRQAAIWPQLFEYCGLPGRAELNGELLRVGDRVLLTESQASAWNDRFRAVDASEVQPVTS